jgi:para-nitrobenzyl esterase
MRIMLFVWRAPLPRSNGASFLLTARKTEHLHPRVDFDEGRGTRPQKREVKPRLSTILTTLLALITTAACSSTDDTPGTDAGPCRTTVAEGALAGLATGKTCEFRGVPFAKPPVGALRFAPPEPPSPWMGTGTLDATRYGSVCTQPIDQQVTGSEDCLYLNVYTPKTPPATKLPVMVWIHGGSFLNGAGSDYDGRLLSEAGPVVVVTVNYRLGPFGFMNLPELDATRPGAPSGNDGIRDQQLALQWVQANAARFGGDPTNVTVFGESAGSFSACFHLISPGSRTLAQHFILESASCLGFGAFESQKPAEPSPGKQLVSALCTGTGAPASEPIACLRSLAPDAIANWQPPNMGASNGVAGPFHPIVEGVPGGVMPESQTKLVAAGQYNQTADIIAGSNQHEAGLLQEPYIHGGLPIVDSLATLHDAVKTYFDALAPLVEAQYKPTTDAEAGALFTTIMTDLLLRCPTRALVRATRANGTAHVYLYSYDEGRAFHTDEIAALLTLGPALARFQVPEPPPALATAMKGYWSRFATTGNPNGDGAEEWPLYDEASDAHLSLADPPKASAHLVQPACDFWDDLLKSAIP